MRKDMNKLVTERSYHWKGGKKGTKKREAWEAKNEIQPKGEPVKRGKGHFLTRLAPLHRFLLSKVGCKWDDVYSEICAGLHTDSSVQSQVRDHVLDFVAVDCFVDNGEIYDAKYPRHPLHAGRCRNLYVLDGILCKSPKKEKYKQYSPKLKFGAGICSLLYKGIWYEVTLERANPWPRKIDGRNASIRDQFLGHVNNLDELYNFYGSYVYCTKKRQMNTKEIKKVL